jgi:methionyl-tRNA formyltransferase
MAGAPLLVQTLVGLDDGSILPQPQNDAGATFAPILTREDGRMDFAAHTAAELKNRWRGFQPWPGAFTALGGKKLIVHRMNVAEAGSLSLVAEAEPGQIHVVGARLFVACAQNSWLELTEIQLEGKKRIASDDFLRGNALKDGARLGAMN